MQKNNDILQILFSYQDKNYAKFVQKLLPKNIDRENIKIKEQFVPFFIIFVSICYFVLIGGNKL